MNNNYRRLAQLVVAVVFATFITLPLSVDANVCGAGSNSYYIGRKEEAASWKEYTRSLYRRLGGGPRVSVSAYNGAGYEYGTTLAGYDPSNPTDDSASVALFATAKKVVAKDMDGFYAVGVTSVTSPVAQQEYQAASAKRRADEASAVARAAAQREVSFQHMVTQREQLKAAEAAAVGIGQGMTAEERAGRVMLREMFRRRRQASREAFQKQNQAQREASQQQRREALAAGNKAINEEKMCNNAYRDTVKATARAAKGAEICAIDAETLAGGSVDARAVAKAAEDAAKYSAELAKKAEDCEKQAKKDAEEALNVTSAIDKEEAASKCEKSRKEAQEARTNALLAAEASEKRATICESFTFSYTSTMTTRSFQYWTPPGEEEGAVSSISTTSTSSTFSTSSSSTTTGNRRILGAKDNDRRSLLPEGAWRFMSTPAPTPAPTPASTPAPTPAPTTAAENPEINGSDVLRFDFGCLQLHYLGVSVSNLFIGEVGKYRAYSKGQKVAEGYFGGTVDGKWNFDIQVSKGGFDVLEFLVPDPSSTSSYFVSFLEYCKPATCAGPRASFRGDVHMKSFDKLMWDCQGHGHFLTMQGTKANGDDDFVIQTIFDKRPGMESRRASVTRSVLINSGEPDGPIIQFSVPRVIDNGCDFTFYVNGQEQDYNSWYDPTETVLINSNSACGSKASTSKPNRPKVTLTYPDTGGTQIIVSISESKANGCTINGNICLGSYWSEPGNEIVGLVGGYPDGNQTNDWIDRNGKDYYPTGVNFLGKKRAPAFDYCTLEYCMKEAEATDFTYNTSAGESFQTFDYCDDVYSDSNARLVEEIEKIPEFLDACKKVGGGDNDKIDDCLLEVAIAKEGGDEDPTEAAENYEEDLKEEIVNEEVEGEVTDINEIPKEDQPKEYQAGGAKTRPPTPQFTMSPTAPPKCQVNITGYSGMSPNIDGIVGTGEWPGLPNSLINLYHASKTDKPILATAEILSDCNKMYVKVMMESAHTLYLDQNTANDNHFVKLNGEKQVDANNAPDNFAWIMSADGTKHIGWEASFDVPKTIDFSNMVTIKLHTMAFDKADQATQTAGSLEETFCLNCYAIAKMITSGPTLSPTKSPTKIPTGTPTKSPTKISTGTPTKSPTKSPTGTPTKSPTKGPTGTPTKSPTISPTKSPTGSPTKSPTMSSTNRPTAAPTNPSTGAPTTNPFNICSGVVKDYLMIGTAAGRAVVTENADLGADIAVLSSSEVNDNVNANLKNIFVNDVGAKWIDFEALGSTGVPNCLPGAGAVHQGVSWSGDVALTSPEGKFGASNTEFYATYGVVSATPNPELSVFNTAFYTVSNTDPVLDSNSVGLPMPANGISIQATSMFDLRVELLDLEDYLTNLITEHTLTPTNGLPSVNGIEDMDIFELPVDNFDVNGDGIAVIDIDMNGAEQFKITNSNWIIESTKGTFAVIRILGETNLVLNNASIMVGDGAVNAESATGNGCGNSAFSFGSLGAVLVKASGYIGAGKEGKSDFSTDAVFDMKNVVLNGVAVYDLVAFSNKEGNNDSGQTSISISNGQGCAQFISAKLSFSNVRFEKCGCNNEGVKRPTPPLSPPTAVPTNKAPAGYEPGGVKTRSPSKAPAGYEPGGAKTKSPTKAPAVYEPGSAKTKSPASGVNGDPHFKTWSGEKYDFHGICDLVLIENHKFRGGKGMDIHVRSKQTLQWSYVSTAVVRIGGETFEVAGRKDGDCFWHNRIQGKILEEGATIAGYPISFRKIDSQRREFVIDLGRNETIALRTWRDMVRVDVRGKHFESFGNSLGLMGSFPDGVHLGRDGTTILNELNSFGMEWQVHSLEPKFFHAIDGPQHPERCEIPTKMALRRRLATSTVSRQEAEKACNHVAEEEHDLCIFDVMAVGDIDAAGAY